MSWTLTCTHSDFPFLAFDTFSAIFALFVKSSHLGNDICKSDTFNIKNVHENNDLVANFTLLWSFLAPFISISHLANRQILHTGVLFCTWNSWNGSNFRTLCFCLQKRLCCSNFPLFSFTCFQTKVGCFLGSKVHKTSGTRPCYWVPP